MKKASRPPLPPHLRAQAEALAAMSDETIDFSDIPLTTDWSGAVRGMFAGRGPSTGGPDPERDVLEDAFRRGWSPASSAQWTPDNPARGQCNVTALVVQDVLACQIRKTMMGGGWHFYNWVDGERLDLTASQFATPPHYDDMRATREEALAGTTEQAYRALRQAVMERLGRPG